MLDIRGFYNTFTAERMVQQHTTPNLRVQKACAFVLAHVSPDDVIFEIGCGVGVLTKALAAQLSDAGSLWAVDISDAAIASARQHVMSFNSHVLIERADVLDPNFAFARISRPPNTIIIPDTLEHLPLDQHSALFAMLNARSAPHAQVLITLPSPEYQAFLRTHNPGELQPIDLSVTEDMCQEYATVFGGQLVSYEHIDVWKPRQYVHARIVR